MDNLFGKYGKRKIYLVTYCAVSAVLLLLTIIFYIFYGRVSYKGNNLRLKSMNTNRIIMLDRNGQELVMERTMFSTSVTAPITISYLGEVISYEFYIDYPGYEFPVEIFTLPDGESIINEMFVFSLDNSPPAYKQTDEWKLFETLRNRYGEKNIRVGLVGLCVFGLALLAFGLGQVIYPESFWKLQHFFTVSEGKPTDFALVMNRMAGCVFLILPFILVSAYYLTGI